MDNGRCSHRTRWGERAKAGVFGWPPTGRWPVPIAALVAYLPRYDAGYWSYYDTDRNLASPYYHRAHIALLAHLASTFPEHAETFGEMGARFRKQLASPVNRLRAVCGKAVQKLRNPPDMIVK